MASVLEAFLGNPLTNKILKSLAVRVIKGTAEKTGISWDDAVAELSQSQSQLESLKSELTNPSITYPSYYLQPFHSYDDGNLSWEAAKDVESASDVMAVRTWKDPDLSPAEASAMLRGAIVDQLHDYCVKNGVKGLETVLDAGCSVGFSSRWLRTLMTGGGEGGKYSGVFDVKSITGMDLSPYFLAVAELRERQLESSANPPKPRIQYVHRLAEDTGFPDESFDIVAFQFTFHECPENVIEDMLKESLRVLKPGGVFCCIDNDPESPTIMNMPPFLASLMKSTEPYLFEYYNTQMLDKLSQAGLSNVYKCNPDHRHRLCIGMKEKK